jgi:hypothetical protein
MLKKLLIPCVGIVALMALGSVALAGVPCLGTSTVVATENNLNCTNAGYFCPQGDTLANVITVNVTVLDCYGTALSGKSVAIKGSGVLPADKFKFANSETLKTAVTNLSGIATTTFSKFGGCGNMNFTATVLGVTLATSNVIYCSNMDKNPTPDGNVNSVDLSLFTGDYGGVAACSDFNCLGGVNSVDLSIFTGHYGHSLAP